MIVSSHIPPTKIFQVPWVITMSITSTRMYRSLSDFAFPDTYDLQSFLSSLRSLCVTNAIVDSNNNSSRTTLRSKGTHVMSIPLTGLQIAVHTHTTHDQYPTPQTNSYISTDKEMQGDMVIGSDDIIEVGTGK